MTREGTVLDGKYEIWKEVGRGGMSIVYLARDKHLNKQWAVKEIKNDGSKSINTLLKGLEREANILKNVDHPVLPRIVDIIEQEGTIYVVMDFIEGTTISERLKEEGAQPQELVIEWGYQLASALDYLHNMKPPVIYRDMKPSNVMIKPEGGVKLIDFGTAKEYDTENNADTTALGTRGYAAPEQFGDSKGRGIYNTDARTDIYNLGATLYHVVTGMNPCEPPYEMKPIREWNPALSSGLEKIILKCTQPDPNDRYQNCRELMYALEHYNELDDTYRKKNKKKLALFVATVVLAIGAGITSFFGYKGVQRIKMDNYNTYIEAGNDYRIENDYVAAAEEYKKAFELDGTDAEAYEKYIQTYIDASHEVHEDGSTPLDLETGLNVVANRVKAGKDGIDKNNAVLFKLAMTYFEELGDYKTAAKYFYMINKADPDTGALAEYYLSVSSILSSTNVDAAELMDEIDRFADYNRTNFTNDNINKFVNYKTLGRIYATYINYSGVAEKAEDVMLQAIDDLEHYTGTELDVNEYYFAYYDDLTVIYQTLAEQSGDELLRAQNYVSAVSYADEYLNILEIKVDEADDADIGGGSDNRFNTAYYNKMTSKASYYIAMGKMADAEKVYQTAEERLGKTNVLSSKLYAEHMDALYTDCENSSTDPTSWPRLVPDKMKRLLELYREGKDVKDIDSNKTWKKRKDTLDLLSRGVPETEEDTDSETSSDSTEEGE